MLECLSPCLEKKDGQKKLNSRAKDEMTLKKDSKLDHMFLTANMPALGCANINVCLLYTL